MGAAPNQVHAFQIFEAVVWPHVQHLPKIVREIKGCASVDLVVVLPMIRSDHPFVADSLAHVGHTNFIELIQCDFTESRGFAAPVDIWMAVRDGYKQIECTGSCRCEHWVGHAGILNVEGRVAAEHMPGFNVGQILAVVFRKIDGVVGNGIVPAIDAEIEHECRAGKSFRSDLSIAPSPPQPIWHQSRHAAGEVSVDDRSIGFVFVLRRAYRSDASAFKSHRLNVLLIVDLHTHLLGDSGHGSRDRATASNWVVYAMLVFQERQD